MGRSLNATFISLIPKKTDASTSQDFRPISMISAPHKIIAKVLSNRIQSMLHEVIDSNQYAFIKGGIFLIAFL